MLLKNLSLFTAIATMLGPSLTVPVKDGKLVLGTWQQIFHLECDIKPRRRTIMVTAIGEGERET